jgi:hypothetical protein
MGKSEFSSEPRMPSVFERAVAKASRAIDARHGERLRFIPKGRADNWGKSVGSAGGRQPIDVVGGLYEGAADFSFMSGDKDNSNFSAQSVNQVMHASIERRYFAADNQPQKGDAIEALDRVGANKFSVVLVVGDGPSRFALILVAQ